MQKDKLLLREFYELCPNGYCDDLLTEQEKHEIANGAMYLTGILQKADTKNGNGREYPYKTLYREIENYQKLVNDNRGLGECDHPDSDLVELKNASHIVTKIWWEGKTVMGKIKILSTPMGNTLKALIKDGVKLGISSRGLGSLREEKGARIVEDDFQLICFDIVSEPSTPGAFLSPQMVNESKARQMLPKNYRIYCSINKILNGRSKDGDL